VKYLEIHRRATFIRYSRKVQRWPFCNYFSVFGSKYWI